MNTARTTDRGCPEHCDLTCYLLHEVIIKYRTKESRKSRHFLHTGGSGRQVVSVELADLCSKPQMLSDTLLSFGVGRSQGVKLTYSKDFM